MKRFGKAIGIVIGLCVGTCCIDIGVQAQGALSDAGNMGLVQGGILTEESVLSDRDSMPAVEGIASNAADPAFDVSVSGILDRGIGGEGLEGSLNRHTGGDRLPDGFEAELFGVQDFYEVLIDDSGSVVGLLSQNSVEEVFRSCKFELEGNGWTAVESGQAHMETYIKGNGSFTWALISCLEVGGDVSVVVQFA